MEKFYDNQHERLRQICNRPKATRTYKGTDKLTETSKKYNHNIHEANLLMDQANTAGGWNILRHEIANFLCRVE